jgi:hypothetical protein
MARPDRPDPAANVPIEMAARPGHDESPMMTGDLIGKRDECRRFRGT